RLLGVEDGAGPRAHAVATALDGRREPRAPDAVGRPEEGLRDAAGRRADGILRCRELSPDLPRRREGQQAMIVSVAREPVAVGHYLGDDLGLRADCAREDEEGRSRAPLGEYA